MTTKMTTMTALTLALALAACGGEPTADGGADGDGDGDRIQPAGQRRTRGVDARAEGDFTCVGDAVHEVMAGGATELRATCSDDDLRSSCGTCDDGLPQCVSDRPLISGWIKWPDRPAYFFAEYGCGDVAYATDTYPTAMGPQYRLEVTIGNRVVNLGRTVLQTSPEQTGHLSEFASSTGAPCSVERAATGSYRAIWTDDKRGSEITTEFSFNVLCENNTRDVVTGRITTIIE